MAKLPEDLRQEIDRLLDGSSSAREPALAALCARHAGFAVEIRDYARTAQGLRQLARAPDPVFSRLVAILDIVDAARRAAAVAEFQREHAQFALGLEAALHATDPDVGSAMDEWARGTEAAARLATVRARRGGNQRAGDEPEPGPDLSFGPYRVLQERPLLAGHLELDDLLQEIWARAAPAAKTAFCDLGPGSLLAFLGKIADRELIDLARRHRAKKRGDGGAAELATGFDAAGAARPGCSTPETPTSRARVAELTLLAQQELNPREFEAWDLVEMREFSAEEAGLAMRCSGSAVRGLLMRARARLVAKLADDRRRRDANGSGAASDSDT